MKFEATSVPASEIPWNVATSVNSPDAIAALVSFSY